jgi:hypothetical protein
MPPAKWHRPRFESAIRQGHADAESVVRRLMDNWEHDIERKSFHVRDDALT